MYLSTDLFFSIECKANKSNTLPITAANALPKQDTILLGSGFLYIYFLIRWNKNKTNLVWSHIQIKFCWKKSNVVIVNTCVQIAAKGVNGNSLQKNIDKCYEWPFQNRFFTRPSDTALDKTFSSTTDMIIQTKYHRDKSQNRLI